VKKIDRIIARAIQQGNVKNNLVICDNCNTPASKSLSLAMSWTGCAPCMLGEADSFDPADLIHVEDNPQ